MTEPDDEYGRIQERIAREQEAQRRMKKSGCRRSGQSAGKCMKRVTSSPHASNVHKRSASHGVSSCRNVNVTESCAKCAEYAAPYYSGFLGCIDASGDYHGHTCTSAHSHGYQGDVVSTAASMYQGHNQEIMTQSMNNGCGTTTYDVTALFEQWNDNFSNRSDDRASVCATACDDQILSVAGRNRCRFPAQELGQFSSTQVSADYITEPAIEQPTWFYSQSDVHHPHMDTTGSGMHYACASPILNDESCIPEERQRVWQSHFTMTTEPSNCNNSSPIEFQMRHHEQFQVKTTRSCELGCGTNRLEKQSNGHKSEAYSYTNDHFDHVDAPDRSDATSGNGNVNYVTKRAGIKPVVSYRKSFSRKKDMFNNLRHRLMKVMSKRTGVN